MTKSLQDARIVDGLPRIVADQDWVRALSGALGILHAKALSFADNSQIYTALDTVPEAVLDALAVNWKIDWYDTEYSVDQKRRIVKTALTARRLMGTAYAVKTQADAIYPGAEVEEWFEYGGTPGRFRVNAELLEQGISEETYRQLLKGIRYTKNVRSHLESINFHTESEGFLKFGAYTSAAAVIEIWPELVTNIEVTGYAGAGGAMAAHETVEIYPALTRRIEATAQTGASGVATTHQTVEVYP